MSDIWESILRGVSRGLSSGSRQRTKGREREGSGSLSRGVIKESQDQEDEGHDVQEYEEEEELEEMRKGTSIQNSANDLVNKLSNKDSSISNKLLYSFYIIIIVIWSLTSYTKMKNYKYADTLIYSLLFIGINICIFEGIQSYQNKDITQALFIFCSMVIFIELSIMIYLTYKYADIYNDPRLQFKEMGIWNLYIQITIFIQNVFYIIMFTLVKNTNNYNLIGLLFGLSALIVYVYVVETFIKLKYLRVDKSIHK